MTKRGLSPSELFASGGGVANERTAALLAEADRGWRRREQPRRMPTSEEWKAKWAIDQADSEAFTAAACRPAFPWEYADWLTGFLNAGGTANPEYAYDFPASRFFTLIANGHTMPSLYGALSMQVLVPAGMDLNVPATFHGACGHSTVYFLDGYRTVGTHVPLFRDIPPLLGVIGGRS